MKETTNELPDKFVVSFNSSYPFSQIAVVGKRLVGQGCDPVLSHSSFVSDLERSPSLTLRVTLFVHLEEIGKGHGHVTG